ncbi:pyridoxamine 5'-phosphate oxidase family protein [Kocuria sp. M1R5S2]|uniref:pyridoxamine 5'-phosphate oxidase family protein n=1 Tax=Kocuria rhizosphaerae TaxID=3376285 RepID=UPI0037930641
MTNRMDISGHNPDKEAREQRPRVVELSEEQCWEHLYSARFGRIATMDGDEIEITPINLVADDGRIFFRTAKGTKLLHLVLDEHVAVQVDHAQGGEAWSVLVRGTAHQLTDPEETARVDELPLRPWLETTKLEYVEVVPTKVTGRLFRLGH